MSGCDNVESVVGHWYVAHVKPSNERRLAAELTELEVEHYLPLVRRNVKRNGKYQSGDAILFPQYLFFAGERDAEGHCEARYKVVLTHRTCGVLEVIDQRTFVRQLRAVQLAIELNPKLSLYPKVTPGQVCRIKSGPMAHIEGFCERINENRAKCVVVLRLNILGQSVSIDFDAENVEPL